MANAAYRSQRHAASKRGIPWELTFEQWHDIWTASGKLAQRGRRSFEYCMARKGDQGAYAVGNVTIVTVRQNHLERDGAAVAASNRRRMADPVWAGKVKELGRVLAMKNNDDPDVTQRRLAATREHYRRGHG